MRAELEASAKDEGISINQSIALAVAGLERVNAYSDRTLFLKCPPRIQAKTGNVRDLQS
jgi:hypothetical protein